MTSSPKLVCCHVPIARSALRQYAAVLGQDDSATALVSLAQAIAASSGWSEVPDATIVVRSGSEPALAVMARADETQSAWLAAQARVVGQLCGRLRLVSYQRAEEDCERLAIKLVDLLGHTVLRRAGFEAVPRGGCIVLGLLATALGLERRQIESLDESASPLVVVDDCALSGARFRQFLARREEPRQVVFAHLYSHSDLRAAILSREPRVIGCVSARNLQPDGSSADPLQQARLLQLLDEVYWIGPTEPLAFPWSEPDRLIQHPVDERPVLGWRIVPPDLCLKNRVPKPIPVQVQPQATGPLQPTRGVIFGERDGCIALHHLGRGESAVLDDVASDLWRAVIRHGSLRQTHQELGRDYQVSGERLWRDVNTFVDQLIHRGFLEWEETADRPADRLQAPS